jgi:osmotically-inducible protein OsmY
MMSGSTSARDDRAVQAAVQEELEWTPDVDDVGIGVSVEDGAVAISGEVDSYAEKLAAKRAVLSVSGVNALVDNLTVRPKDESVASSTEIAQEVRHALSAAGNIPDTVDAEVLGHTVILTGEVQWNFQREAAKRAVQYLKGVHAVDSRITLAARASAADAEERIKNALARNALLDANTITATVDGNTVTLTGTVSSWAEKLQATKAVWGSPHVTQVENNILVSA